MTAPATGAGPARSLAAVFTPVRNTGLVDEICDRIESAVVSGVLTPGQRLPNETEFATALGVSAVTAREALSRLRAQGVVTTTRGRNGGSFIAPDAAILLSNPARRSTPPTRVELADLRSHLQSIAGSCAEAAAERSSPTDIAQLRAYLEGAHDDPREWRLFESEFLLEVAAVARSARLTRELLRIQTESAALMSEASSEIEFRLRLLLLREGVISAIESRNGPEARRLICDLVAAPIDWKLTYEPESHPGDSDAAAADIDSYISGIEQRLKDWAAQLGPRLNLYGQGVTGAVIDRLVKPEVEALVTDEKLGLIGAGFVANVGVVGPDRTHFAWWQGTELDRADVLANFSSHSQTRYLRAEWFRAPLSTGQLEATGPYVDLLCTDDYIVTFTAPVMWSHEPLIAGVAGMDITTPTLERRILASLRTIGDATLVNSEGRAVVSASADISSGDLVPDLDAHQSWPAGSRFTIVTRSERQPART